MSLEIPAPPSAIVSARRPELPKEALLASSGLTILTRLKVGLRRGIDWLRRRAFSVAALGIAGAFAYGGQAFAQAASPSGGIGSQMNLMSSEAINSGGTAFGMACYLAAAVCFGFGVWALWQSRQPQNREAGHVGRGIAGLVLCGLFATAGVWINKAAVTASGGTSTVNDNPAMVQFGSGG